MAIQIQSIDMTKSLHINLIKLDPGTDPNVTGTYWEYYISGQSLKEYLGITSENQVSPFGWYRNRVEEKSRLQEIRMQKKSNLIDHRVELYICAACGDIGCGSVTVQISDLGDIIRWRNFAYSTSEDEVGDPFKIESIDFDRINYFKAFKSIR